jgi:hypothetical protein
MGSRPRLVAERFCQLPIGVDAWEISHTASRECCRSFSVRLLMCTVACALQRRAIY